MTETTPKRLLAISWEMPPLSGPRAVQVTRTLAALPEYGWRSRVISFGPRSNRYNQDFRVSLETLSGGHATLVPVASPEEWFLFRALWRVVPPLKHFPDEKRVWMPGALRAARAALAAAPADVLVSFAQPWTNHLIALQLARETGLPWVAHFSDPWVDSPYFQHGGAIRRRAEAWEREVIAKASRVVFVNTHARERAMAKYPESWHAKASVIPQAWEAMGDAKAPSADTDRPLRIVYTGRFYSGLRTPATLLDALAVLNTEAPLKGRLEIEFVGSDMQDYARQSSREGLDRVVRFSPRVPPSEARLKAAGADVLLVIDAAGADSLFLPSKLIDYLPLRRPILALTPPVGPSADLVRELGYFVAPPDDREQIVAVLRRLLKLYSAARLVPSLQHDTVAERFSTARTTKRFAEVLEQAMVKR